MVDRRLKLTMGLTRVKIPQFASEPGYVAAVNRAVEELTKEVLSIIDQFEDVTPEIMEDVLTPAFELSKVYCPKLTGDLVNSAFLEVVGGKKDPRVVMGYAKGGNPRYAVLQHENLEFRHEAPTQAKFLERAVNESLDEMATALIWDYGKFMDV